MDIFVAVLVGTNIWLYLNVFKRLNKLIHTVNSEIFSNNFIFAKSVQRQLLR